MASEALRQRPPRREPYAPPHRNIPEAQAIPKTVSHSMDYALYLVVVILTMIGVVMVFSSSYLNAATNADFNYDTFYFLKRNSGLAIGGFIAMNIVTRISYKVVQQFAPIIYIITLGLMALVIGIGISSHGMTRWIPLPIPGVNQFQPAELAKPAIIFMLAFVIHRNPDFLNKWSGFIFCLGLVGALAAFGQYGSMSSAIIISLIGVGMLFIASPHVMRFLAVGAAGAAGVLGYLFLESQQTGGDFRGARFSAWLNPWADPIDTGFQIIQSWYAIASGGIFGLGIGQSREKTYLPEPHNDYIFSIICEELGLLGAAVVLILFGVLIWRGIRIALRAPDIFSSLTAAGIVLTVASQVIINVAVVTNTIPSTGITLPFISYGGTSLLISMAMIGVLLNISRYTKER